MSEEVEEKKSSGGGKGLIIVLIVLVVLMMVGMGVLAFLLLSQGKHDDKGGEEAVAEAHAPAAHGDEGDGGHGGGHAKQYSPKFKQYEPPPEDAVPEYFEMKPFVVNFKGEGQAKFLAVTLKFMSYYPQLVGEHGDMEHLRPILRDKITQLLRKQHFSELNQDNGQDILRERILEAAREVLKEHGIYPDLLEGVYFERFVMQ